MENQHRQIKGYRELNAEEIRIMNKIKELGPLIASVISDIELAGRNTDLMPSDNARPCDMRWASIGKTHLQQGLMALVRSVAQPDSF